MMKKLIFALCFMFVATLGYATPFTVDAFVSPDDLTLQHIEDFRDEVIDGMNSFPGNNIQDGTIHNAANDDNTSIVTFREEAFNNWVKTGLTIAEISSSLTQTTAAGTAYIEGERVEKTATGKTYTASKWTYVDLSSNGTYTYTEGDIWAAAPAVTANSMRIARVSTDATRIEAVRDDRVTSINLGSSAEDYVRSEVRLDITSTTEMTISPGVIYHGTNRIAKDVETDIDITTATDWATGISGQGTSRIGYVAIDVNGDIKLSRAKPGYRDSAGTYTDGKLRYILIGTAYWRCIGWFWMNSTGSGELQGNNWGDFKDNGIGNLCSVSGDSHLTRDSGAGGYHAMTNMTMDCYTSGGPVMITFAAPFYPAAGLAMFISIDVDNLEYSHVEKVVLDTAIGGMVTIPWHIPALSQDKHTIDVSWKVTGSTVEQRGTVHSTGQYTEGKRILMLREF